MDFKTPKMQNITDTAVLAGGAVGGALASNYIVAQFIGDEKEKKAKAEKDGKPLKEDDKAMKKALGLGCPCENGLGEPDYFDYRPAYYDYSPQVYVEPEPSKNLLMDFSPKKNYS